MQSSLPTVTTGQHVVLLPDTTVASGQVDPTTCSVAHVDAASERLILEWPVARDVTFVIATGDFVFVLVAQPGDAYYARAFRIENVQQRQAQTESSRMWLVLRPSGKWQRIDRRRADRMPLSHQIADGRRYPPMGGVLRLAGVVHDISEGGLLLETDQHLQLSDMLEFELALDRSYRLRARVLRLQRAVLSDGQKWLAGCKFEGIAPEDSARISNYVSAGQLPPSSSS